MKLLRWRIFPFLLVAMLCTGHFPAEQSGMPNGWPLFAEVSFTPKFEPKIGGELLHPRFTTKLKDLAGKQVKLKGHVMPFDYPDKKMVILSKFPFSSCFFCGGAGPETVAEIHFAQKPGRFKGDEVIEVTGRLVLNDTDIDHMNFQLHDARLLQGE